MAIKEIEKIHFVHAVGDQSAWDNVNIVPLKGELNFVNSQDKTIMVIGDGIRKMSSLINDKKQIFYSGAGANYTLPTASPRVLGGIKINANYFTHNENFGLTPTNYGLANDGSLIFNHQITKFQEIQADIVRAEEYYGTQILETVVNDNYITIIGTTVDDEKIGIKLQNNTNNILSELSVDKQGILQYTSVEGGTPQRVITSNNLSENGVVVSRSGNLETIPTLTTEYFNTGSYRSLSFVDSANNQYAYYNPGSTVDTSFNVDSLKYCKKIELNGVVSEVDEEQKISFDVAVPPTIKYNENVISPDLTNTITLSGVGSSQYKETLIGIDITDNNKLYHTRPDGYVEDSTTQTIESITNDTYLLSTIYRDSVGHTKSSTSVRLSTIKDFLGGGTLEIEMDGEIKKYVATVDGDTLNFVTRS